MFVINPAQFFLQTAFKISGLGWKKSGVLQQWVCTGVRGVRSSLAYAALFFSYHLVDVTASPSFSMEGRALKSEACAKKPAVGTFGPL